MTDKYSDEEIAILDDLVFSGCVISYEFDEYGVVLSFQKGRKVRFGANADATDNPFLEIEQK